MEGARRLGLPAPGHGGGVHRHVVRSPARPGAADAAARHGHVWARGPGGGGPAISGRSRTRPRPFGREGRDVATRRRGKPAAEPETVGAAPLEVEGPPPAPETALVYEERVAPIPYEDRGNGPPLA